MMSKSIPETSYNINLREALAGWVTRLRFITRFSNCPRMHDESVAEHSFYTAFFTLLMCLQLNKQSQRVNAELALSRALMHDIDECFSGDFIRMFKHSDPELKKQIDKACEMFAGELSGQLSSNAFIQQDLFSFWKDAKEGDEGRVVAFADFLSVVSYIYQEIESGNHRMREQVPELRKFFYGFLAIEYGFLREFIEQAGSIITKLETAS